MGDYVVTGYFANPRSGKSTNVHVLRNGKAMCGYKPADGYEFQWCAYDIQLEYVTCSRCRTRAIKKLPKREHVRPHVQKKFDECDVMGKLDVIEKLLRSLRKSVRNHS